MNIDTARIDGRVRQAVSVTERAAAVIANAQSQKWPYSSVSHPVRIFSAIIATQARELAERATKQVGLDITSAAEGRAETVAKFFTDSAEHVGTHVEAMASARMAALDALVAMASDTVARAERVLEGDETLSGRPIAHGALWDK